MGDNTFATALELYSHGFSVIPSGSGDKGKAPAVNWLTYQQRQATQAELEGWEAELSPRLWGVVTGAISGLVVIDADTPEARTLLEAELGPPHILTPRGGGHWYFKHPGQPVKTAVGIVPQVDIRADGGFVNVTGRSTFGEYRILTLPSPDNLLPLERLPEKIRHALNDSKPTLAQPSTTEAIIPEGERNSTLASLAGTFRRRGLSEREIYIALAAINQNRCSPPLPDADLREIAKSIKRYAPTATPSQSKEPIKYKDTPILRDLIDIQPEAVKWLWKPYIPYGKFSLLEGDPGIGKSWVALAIATALSLGCGLPKQDETTRAPVLIASCEDGLADTIRPRLDGMGADLSAISAIDGLFTLDDGGFELLEGWVQQTVPGLLIIDPLVGYLSGELDINKANQVRHGTARLAKLADKYGLAILAIRHLTKGGSLKPIYRGLGSIDFTASARSVLMAGCDPDLPNSRGILHIKSNLAPLGEAIGYELRNDGFFWTDHCDLTIERLFATSEGGSALHDAKAFLLDLLADGEVPANEIYAQADNRDIAKRTLHRAKEELRVLAVKSGDPGEKGFRKWYWKLPQKGA
jgi:hypothetical protein